PNVGWLLQGLFAVGREALAIAEHTRGQDDLFRFKVDFVRRRSLPLLKGGARIEPTAEDDAIVARLVEGPSASAVGHATAGRDLEAAVARAGCALMDREKAGERGEALDAAVNALKRWCAARLHDRAHRDWGSFRPP